MTKGKPKIPPIKAKYVWINGPVFVTVEPEEFLDHVTGKDIPIILFKDGVTTGLGKPAGIRYRYFAIDSTITYFTYVVFEPLPGIEASIETETYRIGQGHLHKTEDVRRDPK